MGGGVVGGSCRVIHGVSSVRKAGACEAAHKPKDEGSGHRRDL